MTDEPPTGGNGDDGIMPDPAAQEMLSKRETGRIVLGVIIAHDEDSRTANETTLRVRGPAATSCPFGGSRTTDENGVTTFSDCGILPGIVLRGGVRFTPGAEGTEGGRIEFLELEGTSNDNPFSVNGSIEKTENEDGSTSYEADVQSSQTADGETDFFNFNGDIKVDDDGSMEGNMRIDSGEDDETPTDCDMSGLNIFDIQNDPSALNGPCNFDAFDDDFDNSDEGEEVPDDDMPDDEGDDGEGLPCDCKPDEVCIEFEGDDGTPLRVCSNCETNEDCVRKGLGNECSLGFSCSTVECFDNDDCPDGFECDGFLGGGDCVEESFFPFPV
ncbi:MAG: hypothetical protein DHS20C16_16100 [Phycisphaerae bacterium]|nr:MAG: hypothetical protein DHS20C16_16100 [Phycisphaerae bacterium]